MSQELSQELSRGTPPRQVIFVDSTGDVQTFISKDDMPLGRPRTSPETTMFEMLTQRGYKVVSECEDFMFAKRSMTDCIVVFFEKMSGLTTDRVYKLLVKTREQGCNHCIIVYKDSVTTYVKNLIGNDVFDKPKTSSATDNISIEIFDENELRINITRHRLQPKEFVQLSTTEVAAFKKLYGTKIPIFSTSDPIVRFYNYKKGDIIALTRADGTKTYRIVK